jgi:hypothetical protein
MVRAERRTNRIAALAVGVGLAMSAVVLPCWWSIFRYQSPSCSAYKPDFISLYTGATLMWSDPTSLYDLEKQRLVQEAIDPTRGSWVLPFFYPPFFAVILVPIGLLSFANAFLTMTVINIILLIVALRLLIINLGLASEQRNWLLLGTFCNYGVHYALLEGQTSFLALLLLVLYVSTLCTETANQAGVWSGLLAFKPQLMVIPSIVLVVRRKWAAVRFATLVIASLALITLAAVGFDGINAYLTASWRALLGDANIVILVPEQPQRMHNLRALSSFIFVSPWSDYTWVVSSCAVIGLLVAKLHWRNGAGPVSPGEWMSILSALILVTPHLHDHDLTLLIVLSAFLLKRVGRPVNPWIALASIGLGIAAFFNTVLYPYLPPLVPIALLAFLIVDFCRERRYLQDGHDMEGSLGNL